MRKLEREDLYTLEAYAATRANFRDRLMAHKRNRRVPIGPNATLSFEDRLTMQYQVQEMLRAERIFEPAGIEEELAAYNPLIPDGTNWKATLMLEFPNVDERRAALARLRGVESRVWARVAGQEPVYAVADEDLDRTTEEKTSSVHFLRFELTREMIRSVKRGAAVAFGIDHEFYRHALDPVPAAVRDSLASDLDDL